MVFDVMERLGYRVSKLFCNPQVCYIKVVFKRTLQVADRLAKQDDALHLALGLRAASMRPVHVSRNSSQERGSGPESSPS